MLARPQEKGSSLRTSCIERMPEILERPDRPPREATWARDDGISLRPRGWHDSYQRRPRGCVVGVGFHVARAGTAPVATLATRMQERGMRDRDQGTGHGRGLMLMPGRGPGTTSSRPASQPFPPHIHPSIHPSPRRPVCVHAYKEGIPGHTRRAPESSQSQSQSLTLPTYADACSPQPPALCPPHPKHPSSLSSRSCPRCCCCCHDHGARCLVAHRGAQRARRRRRRPRPRHRHRRVRGDPHPGGAPLPRKAPQVRQRGRREAG